jgi:ribosomal protein L17
MTTKTPIAKTAAQRRILTAVLAIALINGRAITLTNAKRLANLVYQLMPNKLAKRLAKSADRTALDDVLPRLVPLLA